MEYKFVEKNRRRIGGWISKNAGISLIDPEIRFLNQLAMALSQERGEEISRSQVVREALESQFGIQWADLANEMPANDHPDHANELNLVSYVEKPGTEPVEDS